MPCPKCGKEPCVCSKKVGDDHKKGSKEKVSPKKKCPLKCDCCKKVNCSSKKTQIPTVTPVGKPVDRRCGGFEWKVVFNLPEVTCKGGWIVQELKLSFDVKNKDGSTKLHKNYHFWEAWEVEKCKKVTVFQDKKLDDNDDIYRMPPSPGTKGTHTAIGKVKFYEGSLPADFKKRNPKTLAGTLHSTAKKPGFWDGGGTAHNLVSKWDCTDGKNNASVITTVP